jgi:predicted transcriptional regulator
MDANGAKNNLVELAADIVSAYVANNSVRPADLPELISSVHAALSTTGAQQTQPEAEPRTPAVPIKKSIGGDYIICLDDGKKFKSLKRHLRTKYGMTPEQYREKWGLPKDYPMVAPAYAQARSELAKSMGLGQQRKKSAGKRGSRKAA